MKLSPTALDGRIESLDIMRGFALLGIFIANMLVFHTPYMHLDPYTWFSSNSDEITFRWIDIFVQGSFYPIFAFLFGYGINMQYEKSLDRKTPFAPLMAKRLSILLVIGLLHALLIWSGDVLFAYASLGFLLILLVRIPAKWLIPFAAALYIIPVGLIFITMRIITKTSPDLLLEDFADVDKIESSIQIFANGTFGEIFTFRFFEWLVVGLGGAFMGIFIVLPIIMLGAALSKLKVIERAGELRTKIALVTVVGLALGIWIKVLPHLGNPTYDLVLLQDTLGGVILAAGYVGLLLLLCTNLQFRKVFGPVGKAGRMSLTTYITQSIVATTIFYSYGFGLYGKVDLITGTWIAVGVFILQVIFAELWLKKFRMGPLEWIWRRGTYGGSSSK